MLDFLKKIRISIWWNHISPPIIASIYYTIWYSDGYYSSLWISLVLFLISLCCIAGFGYFLNDITDVETDRLAGKANSAARLSKYCRLLIAGGMLLFGLIPWMWLPRGFFTFGFLLLLIFLVLVYSAHPFRFKENGSLGLLCDIHYGHILPVFIAVNTFSILLEIEWSNTAFVFIVLYTVFFFKGLRNILLHQIEDEPSDFESGSHTYTVVSGIKKTKRLVNAALITESILLIILLFILELWLLIVWGVFLAVNLLLVISWGTFKLPRKVRIEKFWFLLNDFYEEWLPFVLILMVVLKHNYLWWFLPVHFLLFHRGILNVALDFKNTWKWLYLISRRFYFNNLQKKLHRFLF